MTKCGVSSLYVINRDGRSEPFNFAKVEKVVKYAAEGLNIDISEFFNEFQFLFRNGITTKELQTDLNNTANKMVYRKGQIRPEYSILANRLFLMDFWKETPPGRRLRLRRHGTVRSLGTLRRWPTRPSRRPGAPPGWPHLGDPHRRP